jgi:serine/threonine-protein kinase RsbT
MSTIVAIATVLSELARNIFQYAGTGEIEIQVLDSNPLAIEIISRDQGPGITNLESILRKEFNSHASNIGQGLRTVKLLMDEFDVSNISSKGTEIRAKKYIS